MLPAHHNLRPTLRWRKEDKKKERGGHAPEKKNSYKNMVKGAEHTDNVGYITRHFEVSKGLGLPRIT